MPRAHLSNTLADFLLRTPITNYYKKSEGTRWDFTLTAGGSDISVITQVHNNKIPRVHVNLQKCVLGGRPSGHYLSMPVLQLKSGNLCFSQCLEIFEDFLPENVVWPSGVTSTGSDDLR